MITFNRTEFVEITTKDCPGKQPKYNSAIHDRIKNNDERIKQNYINFAAFMWHL